MSLVHVLALGFLVGMRHAVEADHVAAVASLATGSASRRETVWKGVLWGVGHTLTLFAVAVAVLAGGATLTEETAQRLELAVGVMLVLLGLDVLRRLVRERVHFHAHAHEDGRVHLHAHAHRGEAGPHDPARHVHRHPAGLPLRALAVGMMHGMAGSAALLVLAAGAVGGTALGLLYVAVFGLGSILGMGLLSAAMSVPLAWSARALTWAHNGVQAAIGLLTLGLGARMVWELGVAGGALLP
ncbi:hypothetical protein [Inmirania thermothiophila]|uniref:Nickel/cobalt efflux system n=1 Tax=Inmirania thermothiophila TaxID=1750597 RepID=A0A3N1Y125_9GAMM|nr:hypothetical protein [Inmirania thermothiophila]ROR32534.1 ABC-type nickel/cobalt efflux system permease component RcnA [Inmirania thermothiophila]